MLCHSMVCLWFISAPSPPPKHAVPIVLLNQELDSQVAGKVDPSHPVMKAAPVTVDEAPILGQRMAGEIDTDYERLWPEQRRRGANQAGLVSRGGLTTALVGWRGIVHLQ